MVVDTSALIAVALGESDAGLFRHALETASDINISAVSKLEVGIVAAQRNVFDEVMLMIEMLNIKIHTFDDQQCQIAKAAHQQFGKGRHPAALNFGDCCSYALATNLGWPLLFKGNDFSQTDIASALA